MRPGLCYTVNMQRSTEEFPIAPPIEPMFAKLADALPPGGGFLFEPNGTDFAPSFFAVSPTSSSRAVSSGHWDRYFPELHEALLAKLPRGCVLDGEIVIRTPQERHIGSGIGLMCNPPFRRPETIPRYRHGIRMAPTIFR